MAENVYKVKLASSLTPSDIVVFDVTPDLSETRSVTYKTVEPVHSPGPMMAFEKTGARVFNLNAKFVSRSQTEADLTLRRMQALRTWTMPRFGASSLREEHREARRDLYLGNDASSRFDGPQATITNNPLSYGVGVDYLGAPPEVLLLSAYSNTPRNGETYNLSLENIRKVPVVITNLSFEYPSDVTYIPAASNNTPVATIITMSITLTESHSPREYENFSLEKFRQGKLGGF